MLMNIICLRPAVFAILILIFTVHPGHLSYYKVPSAILVKVYLNLMVVILNSPLDINANGKKLHDAFSTFNISRCSGSSMCENHGDV